MTAILIALAVIIVLGAGGALSTILFLEYLQKISKTRLPKTSSDWIEVSDSRIHYSIKGKGECLVLLHGLGASSFIWRFVSAKLAEHFTVIAVDLPGFGLSSKNSKLDYGLDAQTKRVVELLDRLSINEATLVGSSMGGSLALWMAHENPKRFRNVITMAPSTSPSLVPKFALPFKHAAPIFQKSLNAHTMRVIASRVLYNQEILTEEAIAAYLRPYLEDEEAIHTFWRALDLIRDRRMPGELNSLSSRVLVMWGENDRIVSRRCMTELIKSLPHAEFRTHEKCGHHPMEDQPEWVVSEIKRFLNCGMIP